MILNTRVLVLNQNYEPLSICNARRAIILIYQNKAEIVERNHHFVRSPTVSIPLPSIVRLQLYIRIPRKRILLNRRNILRRDNNRCQYCGSQAGLMTIDHVVPRVRGGGDTWENLVCACTHCNTKKGNKTPEQAGMPLLKKPKKPGHLHFMQQLAGNPDDRWKPYLFMS